MRKKKEYNILSCYHSVLTLITHSWFVLLPPFTKKIFLWGISSCGAGGSRARLQSLLPSVATKRTHTWVRLLIYCGAGGSRTHVRTRKPYTFYTLIPAFGFRISARPGPPTDTLSSKFSSHSRGFRKTISDFPAPLNQEDSEQHPLSDVSSPYLVRG